MRLKQWAMIRVLDWWIWEANFNSHMFTQSEWWSYYGCQYFWEMGKMCYRSWSGSSSMSWQTADCTATMPYIICWVDELIYGDHSITAGELCSTQSINKGSEMGIIEECNYSKVWACLLPWMLTDAQKDNESDFHWSFASIWECGWGLPFAHCHGLETGSTILTQIQASVDWMVNCQVEISRLQTFGMRKLFVLVNFLASGDNGELTTILTH